jgi:hypothetical protein
MVIPPHPGHFMLEGEGEDIGKACWNIPFVPKTLSLGGRKKRGSVAAL